MAIGYNMSVVSAEYKRIEEIEEANDG